MRGEFVRRLGASLPARLDVVAFLLSFPLTSVSCSVLSSRCLGRYDENFVPLKSFRSSPKQLSAFRAASGSAKNHSTSRAPAAATWLSRLFQPSAGNDVLARIPILQHLRIAKPLWLRSSSRRFRGSRRRRRFFPSAEALQADGHARRQGQFADYSGG